MQTNNATDTNSTHHIYHNTTTKLSDTNLQMDNREKIKQNNKTSRTRNETINAKTRNLHNQGKEKEQ